MSFYLDNFKLVFFLSCSFLCEISLLESLERDLKHLAILASQSSHFYYFCVMLRNMVA